LQPSRVMSKSGRWVASPSYKQGSPANSSFGRPSKASSGNSPLASQGFSNQPYKPSATVPSHGPGPFTGPIIASWDASVPSNNPQVLPGNNTGLTSSAPISAASTGPPSTWSGFTNLFRPSRNRPQQHRLGSGALLDHADPVLGSIAESDAEAGIVDASLHTYHSTDLDAVNAASSVNKLWAISSPSLSPRRNASASQASDSRTDSQTGAGQGGYRVPSPWSTPIKPSQSSTSSSSPGSYPVPSPQNAPLGQAPSQSQSSAAYVGPFEAAARARAAQSRAGSPGDSTGGGSSSAHQADPSPAVYPVPSPSSSEQQQDGAADTAESGPSSSSRASSRATPTRSMPNRPGYPVPSPISDWSTGIAGMSTTKATSRSSSAGSRRRKL